jgi:integrase
MASLIVTAALDFMSAGPATKTFACRACRGRQSSWPPMRRRSRASNRSRSAKSEARPAVSPRPSACILGSTVFANLAAETQRTRRNILERLREEHGDKRIAGIEKKHVQAMVTAKGKTPSAARNFLITLRALIAFAIDAGIRADDDPTLGVKRPKIKTDGYRTWTEDDIAAFEATHPIGTLPRLAMTLLLCTGQRRGDVVRMGRQHIRGDLISVRQQKTGTPLLIPMHPALRAAIEATPSGHLTFLATAFGKARAANGFSTWFRQCCNAAGLANGTSAHGLRKAACRRLAEAGCSAKEIMAISGHASLHEVERYTKAVDQEHMARAAMKRLGGGA